MSPRFRRSLIGHSRSARCPGEVPERRGKWACWCFASYTGRDECRYLERLSMIRTQPLEIPSQSRERTILTTDIVGSTVLLRRFPNDMMGAMDLHDQILYTSIRRHSGDPFRSTGDGVLAAFDRPADAVMAAIEAQREMRRVAWGPTGRLQVRFGIDTGLTRARGANDYFGPALPTATSLQSAANADQILRATVTVHRLASELARSPFQLSDLGEHHFKGIEPIRVH